MARKIEVEIIGDASSLERAFGKASSSVSGFGSSLARVGKVAAVAGTALAAGVGVGLKSSVEAAVDFEREMRNVNSIAGLGDKQFKQLGKSVTGMAAEVGQKPKVLAAGLYDIVSSGFKAGDAVKVLRVSAKAATAGLTDTATSAKAVTAALNAYHLGADHAREVSDVLFQTVNKGVLTFEELSNQMGNLVPAAAPLGVSLDEVGAAMATLTLQGVNADEAATRVKNSMLALAKPTPALSKLLKEQGFESGTAAIKSRGYAGVLDLLSKATHGSVAAQAKLTPEIRTLLGVVGLTGKNLKTYNENLRAMKEAQQGAGVTSRVFAEQSKSVGVMWQKASAAIDVFKIQLGTALLPALASGIKAVGGFFADLNKAEGFRAKLNVVWTGLEDAAQKIVTAIRGAMDVVDWSSVGASIVNGIKQGLSKAQEIAGELSAILSQTMASVNWEQVGTTVGPGIAAGLLAGLATILDPGFWARHWEEMLAVALAVFPFGRLATLGGKIVTTLVKPVADLLGPTLGRAIAAAGDVVLTVAERLGTRLGSVFLEAVLLAGRTFARLPGAIAGAIGNLGAFVAGKLGSFKTFVIKALAFDAIIHATVAAVNAVAAAMGELPGKVREKLSELGAVIKGYAGSAYAYAFDIGRAIVDGIIGGLGDLASRVGSAISSAVGGAISHVKGVFGIHSPSTVTKEEIGKPLGEGVVEGWILGSAPLGVRMTEKLKQSIDAARQTVDNARGALTTSFGNLASDALSAFDAKTAAWVAAFDAKTSAWVAPGQKLLDKLIAKEDVAAAKQRLADLGDSVTAALADLAKLQSAPLDVTVKEGEDPQKIADDTAKAQQKRNDDIIAARAKLGDAVNAYQAEEHQQAVDAEKKKLEAVAAEQTKHHAAAAAEQVKQHDARAAVDRRNLEADLTNLTDEMTRKGATAAQATQGIVALLATYGVSFAQVGRDMGIAWIQAFKDAIAEAAGKSGKLSSVIGDLASGIAIPSSRLPSKRALGGPVMAGVPYWVGERGPELFMPGQAGTIVPHGAGGGDVYVNVGTVIGTSLDKAVDEIYAGLLRKRGRNGSLGLA